MPVLLHQLTELVNGVWHSERREYEREPAIRGTEQNGAQLLLARLLVVTAQVRMATIACRKIFHALGSEGIGHTPLLAAGFAQHLDIGGLARDTKFAQFEPCLARYLSMHKAYPWEIIQVSIFARHQKAGRHYRRRRTCR